MRGDFFLSRFSIFSWHFNPTKIWLGSYCGCSECAPGAARQRERAQFAIWGVKLKPVDYAWCRMSTKKYLFSLLIAARNPFLPHFAQCRPNICAKWASNLLICKVRYIPHHSAKFYSSILSRGNPHLMHVLVLPIWSLSSPSSVVMTRTWFKESVSSFESGENWKPRINPTIIKTKNRLE